MTNALIMTSELITTNDATATMTSLEIAKLVESRHDNVMVSINRLANSGVIRLPAMQVSEEINNLGFPVKRKHYVFSGEQGKRDSIIVVAQLSPEFTARLVDRWQELEEQVRNQTQAPEFKLPGTYLEALEDLVGQVRENQKLTAKLDEQEPMVEKYRQFLDSDGAITTTKAVQALRCPGITSARKLHNVLYELKVIYQQSGVWVMTSKYEDKGWHYSGLFTDDYGRTHLNSVKWTPAGLDGIRDLLERKGYYA